jgi:large subunit ribosomal protein L20
MPRAKGGPKTRRRHKRQLKLASGFVGGRKLYKQARSTLEKGLTYAYRDRKQKKRDYRTLWIARINALARESGISYSSLMNGLKESGRRGRSQDAREARAGARRIVYRAGAHREERARLASSIEPRRSKRRAPGNHVGRLPTWFFVFGFSVRATLRYG